MQIESPRQKYNPSTGGHAPGHLRDALVSGLQDFEADWWQHLEMDFFDQKKQEIWDRWSDRQRAAWLIGQLWNCDDIVGSLTLDAIDLPECRTFARLVRKLAEALRPHVLTELP